MSLLSLPDELILSMTNHLRSGRDCPTPDYFRHNDCPPKYPGIPNLRVTCKRLCRLLTPLTFRGIILEPTEYGSKSLNLFNTALKDHIRSVTIISSTTDQCNGMCPDGNAYPPLTLDKMNFGFLNALKRLHELPHIEVRLWLYMRTNNLLSNTTYNHMSVLLISTETTTIVTLPLNSKAKFFAC